MARKKKNSNYFELPEWTKTSLNMVLKESCYQNSYWKVETDPVVSCKKGSRKYYSFLNKENQYTTILFFI